MKEGKRLDNKSNPTKADKNKEKKIDVSVKNHGKKEK